MKPNNKQINKNVNRKKNDSTDKKEKPTNDPEKRTKAINVG